MRNQESPKKAEQHFLSNEKNYKLGILYQQKIFFRNEGAVKMFSDEGKLKAFSPEGLPFLKIERK